jgi:rubrerythrin
MLIKPSDRLAPSRRCTLIQLALGTSAFGLLGCGPRTSGEDAGEADEYGGSGGTPDASPDVAPLVAQHLMEQSAVALYHQLAPYVGADVNEVFAVFRGHHQAHADEVKKAIDAAGGSTEPFTAPPLPPLEGEKGALRHALTIETEAARAYLSALSQFRDPGNVARAGDILGSEVAHVIVLREALADDLGPDFAHARDLDFLHSLKVPPTGGRAP